MLFTKPSPTDSECVTSEFFGVLFDDTGSPVRVYRIDKDSWKSVQTCLEKLSKRLAASNLGFFLWLP